MGATQIKSTSCGVDTTCRKSLEGIYTENRDQLGREITKIAKNQAKHQTFHESTSGMA